VRTESRARIGGGAVGREGGREGGRGVGREYVAKKEEKANFCINESTSWFALRDFCWLQITSFLLILLFFWCSFSFLFINLSSLVVCCVWLVLFSVGCV